MVDYLHSSINSSINSSVGAKKVGDGNISPRAFLRRVDFLARATRTAFLFTTRSVCFWCALSRALSGWARDRRSRDGHRQRLGRPRLSGTVRMYHTLIMVFSR